MSLCGAAHQCFDLTSKRIIRYAFDKYGYFSHGKSKFFTERSRQKTAFPLLGRPIRLVVFKINTMDKSQRIMN